MHSAKAGRVFDSPYLGRLSVSGAAACIEGSVVEGDVRRASILLRSYQGKVKLVVTCTFPIWTSLTTMRTSGCVCVPGWSNRRPITGQGKDRRHRRVETYWQFMRRAWKGIVPLLHDSAQVVVRIGGTRLAQEELRDGLLESLNSTGQSFRLAEARQTDIQNGQRRIFQTMPQKASVEHDFRFNLA